MSSKRIFSYFGNKQKIAPTIWQVVGDPLVYIEPFGGSISNLLERPNVGTHEVVGEVDANIINFFTSVKNDPGSVWKAADMPTDETNLKNIDQYIKEHTLALGMKMSENIEFYDPHMAGLWIYRQCNAMKAGRNPSAQIRTNSIYNNPDPLEKLHEIAQRIRKVKFLNGDWKRTIYRTLKDLRTKGESTFIFLDPPYNSSVRKKKDIYVNEDFDVSTEVGEWAKSFGGIYKICVAGLKGEHEFPDDWSEVAWTNDGGAKGKRNQERLWFSPVCGSQNAKL